MRAPAALAAGGAAAACLGALFALQGRGLAGPASSFMYEDPWWAAAGPWIAAAGAAAACAGAAWAARRRARRRGAARR